MIFGSGSTMLLPALPAFPALISPRTYSTPSFFLLRCLLLIHTLSLVRPANFLPILVSVFSHKIHLRLSFFAFHLT